MTLLYALAIGRRAIAHDLGYRKMTQFGSRPISLGSAHLRLSRKGTATLTLRASALGGRVLRLMSIVGLSHHIAIQLHLPRPTRAGGRCR